MKSFKGKSSKPSSWSNRLNKSWITIFGFLIFVIGVLFIILSYEVPVWVPAERTEGFSEVTMTFGQVLVSISVTGLMFEHFGYVDYTTRRICDILVRDEVLDILSQKRKEELKDRLFEDIYLGRRPEPDPLRLVDQLDEDIDRLLADYYYEEYFTSCDISIVETLQGQKLFRKQIRRNMTVRPIRTGQECTLKCLYQVQISGLENAKDKDGNPLDTLKITKLVVQGETLKEGENEDYSLKISPQPDDSSSYTKIYEIVLNPKWTTFSNELRVEMTYETNVLYSDPFYAVTVDRPCKFFSCNFNFHADTHDLLVKGYGFMSKGDTLRKHQIKMPYGVIVRYRSWILPGDGAVAFFYPKTE